MQTVYCINIDFITAGDVTILLMMSQYCCWCQNTAGCGYHDNDNAGQARALHNAFQKGQLLFTGVSHPAPLIKSLCLSGSTLLSYYKINTIQIQIQGRSIQQTMTLFPDLGRNCILRCIGYGYSMNNVFVYIRTDRGYGNRHKKDFF